MVIIISTVVVNGANPILDIIVKAFIVLDTFVKVTIIINTIVNVKITAIFNNYSTSKINK